MSFPYTPYTPMLLINTIHLLRFDWESPLSLLLVPLLKSGAPTLKSLLTGPGFLLGQLCPSLGKPWWWPLPPRDLFIGLSRFMGTLSLDFGSPPTSDGNCSFHVDNSLPTSLVTFSTQNSPWHLNKGKGDPFMSQFFFLLSNIFVCLLHSQTFLYSTMCLFSHSVSYLNFWVLQEHLLTAEHSVPPFLGQLTQLSESNAAMLAPWRCWEPCWPPLTAAASPALAWPLCMFQPSLAWPELRETKEKTFLSLFPTTSKQRHPPTWTPSLTFPCSQLSASPPPGTAVLIQIPYAQVGTTVVPFLLPLLGAAC